jgi:Tfp pilus assembly protein PilO
MNKLLKEKRDRIILVVLGTVFLIAGVWFGLIKSQRGTLEKYTRDSLQAQEKVTNAKRRIEKEKQIQAELDLAGQELKTIEDGMASGDLYSWLIVTLNKFRIPYKNRVEIPNFSRETIAEVLVIPNFPYKAATFTIRGTAYYHDLGRFVADFENTFLHTRLLNLELEPLGLPNLGAVRANPDEEEKLTFKMDIVTLIKPTT